MNLGFLDGLFVNRPYAKYFLLLFAGSLLTFCFAPFCWILLLCVSYQIFFYVIEKEQSQKQRMLSVFVFFMGFFSSSLYWLFYSFKTVGLAIFGPLAVVGLAILLSIITGIFFIFFPSNFADLSFWRRRLFFAGCFFAGEFLRGHVLTGFPWNLTGYAWPFESILQVCSVIGIYGLTFITILTAAFLLSRCWKIQAVLLVCWVAILIWGNNRIDTYQKQTADSKYAFNVRLVQPSISQTDKWDRQKFWKHIDRLIALSELPAERPLSFIIWPEASVTTYLDEHPDLMKIVSHSLSKQTHLIAGAPRRHEHNIYNSLFVLNHEGKILRVYDKTHLTPFGEYIPLPSILPFKKLTHGFSDFSSGSGLEVIKIDKLPAFVPLICYEAIHPGYVMPTKKESIPRWLLNITNDAWFGRSIGPHQHFKIVRIRSIEEGLPMVRVANNGISAVIDSCGQVIQKLDTDDIGIIDEQIPSAFASTFYGTYHKVIDAAFFVFSIIFIAMSAGIGNVFKKNIIEKNF